LALHRCELLSRLSPAAQNKALQDARRRKEGQGLAARVIHSMLARKSKRLDLAAIETKIIDSIRHYVNGR
jgi:hypothetical protein